MDYRIQQAAQMEIDSAKLVAKRLFETYDRNRNGIIDYDESIPMIVDAYKSFNRQFQPTRGDIDSYLKVMDKNGDGKVTYADIEDLCIKYLCPQYMQQAKVRPVDPKFEIVKKILKKYDKYNNGALDPQDLQRALIETTKSLGLQQPNQRDLAALLDQTDQNGQIQLIDIEQYLNKGLQG